MDITLQQIVKTALPKMNEDILNGITSKQLETAESFINDIIKSAEQSFPPGLKFLGSKRCTPLEQFNEITRPSKPMRLFELSRSDIYLVKYMFAYNGVKLRPQYLYLMFNEHDLLFLKGTQYRLTPVISGKLFNIEQGSIYMPTPRAQLGFSAYRTSVIVTGRFNKTGIKKYNDNAESEPPQLLSKIVNSTGVASLLFNMEKKHRSKLHPMIIHYILAEYGLTKTLSLFFKVNARIGNAELDRLDDTWVIYRSRQIPSINKRYAGAPSQIRIAIPLAEHYPLLDSVISSIFYIIDNAVDSTRNVEELDIPLLWLQVMDRFIFDKVTGDKSQFDKMISHLETVKTYIDPITKRILNSEGIRVESIFDLFAYLCLNFHDLEIHYDFGTMYDKELYTVRYLLSNIVSSIFITMWKLQKLPPNLISVEKLNKQLAITLSRNSIFSAVNHGELTAVSIATECKPYSATANMISHNKASASMASKKNRKSSTDGTNLLHPSQLEVSSYSWITSSEPTGRSKHNPFSYFSRGYHIAPRNELREDIKALNYYLNEYKENL